MLQLILGRAGSGKSTLLQQKLFEQVTQGGRALLLVPEQFSFESERHIYRTLDSQHVDRVEVVSFTRLAQLVFRHCGGIAGRRLDDASRLLLMRVALDEVSDQFSYYKNISGQSSFLQLMIKTISDFKMAGISPSDLFELRDRTEDEILQKKWGEISLCYEAFESLIQAKFVDPLNDVGRAADLAAQSGFFTNYHLYIDGFMSFTGAQLEFLRVMVEDCQGVTAAFCVDPQRAEEHSIFSSTQKSAIALEDMAKNAFVEIAKPVELSSALRFENNGPAAAECILSGREWDKTQPMDWVSLVGSAGPYDEVEYTAAEITRLVRQEGLRYRDIAVICRDVGRYSLGIESVFNRHDIPVFLDNPVDLKSHPFVIFLLSALEAARGEYKTRELLSLAKSPLMGFSVEQAGALENYCYIWSVEGAQWGQEFTTSPDGVGRVGSSAAKALAELNDSRSTIVKCLDKLKIMSAGCTGGEFARACYDFFVSTHSHKNFLAYCENLSPAQNKSALELGQAVWDRLMDIFDLFATLLEKVRKPLGQCIELLCECIALSEVGQIPQTLDQVGFGDARRMRPHAPKAVFLLGANQGVFPAGGGGGGAFSRREQAMLGQMGVEIGLSPTKAIIEERFYFYRAATVASHHLYVLCAKNGAKGEQLEPSMPYTNLTQALPHCVKEGETELCHRVCNTATAREELARVFSQEHPHVGSLVRFLEQRGDAAVIATLKRAYAPSASGDISPKMAAELFGRELSLSATRVEEFYRCSFRYFCKFALRVEPLRRAGFSPLESGSVIHRVLEEMVRRHGGGALNSIDSVRLHQEIVKIIEDHLQEFSGDSTVLGARTLYQFHRMVSVLVRIIQRLGGEFAQSLFCPLGVEVKVGGDGPVLPLSVKTDEGVTVSVRGSIDRVDVMRSELGDYARVIDYKSGGKSFDLTDVYHGINMQMLLYLFALCGGGQGEFSGLRPAGILYMPATVEALDLPRDTEQEAIESSRSDKLCMNGLILHREELILAMEEALEGRYIPIKRLKNGEFSKTASLADEKQLESIRQHVLHLVGEMGDRLYGGRVAPKPMGKKSSSPCDYCDYHELCHRDWLRPPPPYEAMKTEELYELLDSREGGDESGC